MNALKRLDKENSLLQSNSNSGKKTTATVKATRIRKNLNKEEVLHLNEWNFFKMDNTNKLFKQDLIMLTVITLLYFFVINNTLLFEMYNVCILTTVYDSLRGK